MYRKSRIPSCRRFCSSRGALAVALLVTFVWGSLAVDGAVPPPAGWQSHRSPITGLLSYLAGPGRGDLPVAASDDPLAILRSHGAAFGVTAPETELSLMTTSVCVLGDLHSRYQQVFGGVPVFTGQLIVHQHPDGTFTAVNGDFYPIPKNTPTEPLLTAGDALFLVGGALGSPDARGIESELVIVDPRWYGDLPIGGVHLAWRLIVELPGVSTDQILIDAIDGAMLDRWPAHPNALNRRINDGTGQNGGAGPVVRLEGDAPTGDPVLDAGYDLAGDMYRLLQDGYGRDSIDGSGMAMRVTGHWDGNICPNATWNGSRASFCDGLLTDDVLGHEYFHGVTQFTANLIYQNQAGQLNESFSDVFGELLDLWNGDAILPGPPGGAPAWPSTPAGAGLDTPNTARTGCGDGSVRWLMGEESSFGAIRDMYSPDCENSPSSTSSFNYPCNPNIDQGGVHSGSGVPNHAFAMLVDGKTYDGITVTGIGAIRAGAIWFRTVTVYLTPSSLFTDAYPLFLQAGNDLLGTNPNDPRTGAPSGDTITAADLVELEDSLNAVGFNAAGVCGLGPPPANDECVDAIVAGPGLTPFDSTSASNSTAPYPSGLCDPNSLGQFAKDVWFSFTPPATGLASFILCGLTGFDTDLAIYTGDCPSLTPIACNGDTAGCSVFTSEIIDVPVTAGVEYLVRIGAWEQLVGLPGDLQIDYLPIEENCNNGIDDEGDGLVDCLDPECDQEPNCQWPGNVCDQALPAAIGANALDTTGAFTSGEPAGGASCGGTNLGGFNFDVWYSFTPAVTGFLTASTCGSASFDTDLAIFTGSCGNLSQFACNGNGTGCSVGTSLIDVVVTGGVPLFLRVGGRTAGDSGTGNLSLSLFVPAEVCANGIDDDFDGATDCADADCALDPVCVCDPIAALVCTPGLGLQSDLSWTNGELYDSIIVRRNGISIATVAGATNSYIDLPSVAGTYDYQLIAQCGGLQTTSSCQVTVVDQAFFTLSAATVTVQVPIATGDATFDVDVALAEDPGAPGFPSDTQGFSLGLAHDALLATAISGAPLGVLALMNGGTGPEFFNEAFPVGGYSVGVIYSFAGTELATFASTSDLLRITYETVPAPFIGGTGPTSTALDFSNQVGVPPVETVVVVLGASLAPNFVSGAVNFEPLTSTPFQRGDCNTDGGINIADAITSLAVLFTGGMTTCRDACDSNDDGQVNIADPIYLLDNLFTQGSPPPAPTGSCGIDPTPDSEECDLYGSCP